MNSLRNIEQKCSITTEDLLKFKLSELNTILNTTIGVTKVSTDIKLFFGDRKRLSPAEYAFIGQHIADLELKKKQLIGQVEEHIYPLGGDLKYEKEKVTVTRPDAMPVEMILTPMPVEKAKPYSSLPTVLLCAMFEMKDGILNSLITDKEITMKYGHAKSKVSPKGAFMVKDCFIDICTKVQTAITVMTDKRSLSKNAFYTFVNDVLNACAYADYFALHTMIAKEFFRGIEFKDGEHSPVRINIGGKSELKFPSGTFVQIQEANCPGVLSGAGYRAFYAYFKYKPWYWVKGVNSSKKFILPETNDIISAITAMNSSRSFRGSDAKGVSLIAGCDGFASMISPLFRKYITIVSTVIGLLRNGTEVDIQVPTNEIPIIHSSILHYYGPVKKLLMYKVEISKINQVHSDYHSFITSTLRPGSHLVSYYDIHVPSSVLKKELLEPKMSTEANLFLSSLPAAFTVFCPVYSHEFFKYTVSRFRKPWDFMGCVSTSQKSYFAYGDKDFIEMEPVANLGNWLSSVISANGFMVSYFINPVTFFSPHVNVIHMKKSRSFTFTDEEGYIENGAEIYDVDDKPLDGAENVAGDDQDEPPDADEGLIDNTA